jgi:L-seryl-tRNA(Ser) seleniumtransferase
VGTTNKTRLADYLDAVTGETALLLKVHRSNFALVGFTEETPLPELAAAGRSRGLPLMVDLGSGALVDLAPAGLEGEPTVPAVVAGGADLCAFSGDKLLGGPQAGILVGRRDLVERIRKHPLLRALRPDKLSLAALEATLEIYREGTAREEIPTLRMLTASLDELAARKDRLLATLRAAGLPLELAARRLRSAVGGGALPLAEPETWTVALRHRTETTEAFAARLARGPRPLVVRIVDDQVVLDVRTLEGGDLEEAAIQVAAACGVAAQGNVRLG